MTLEERAAKARKREWEVYYMVHVNGMRKSEVAKSIGRTPTTVGRLYDRHVRILQFYAKRTELLAFPDI